jgi:hypothetical protein
VFDFREKEIIFDDTLKNEKLDGRYKAKINETLDTIKGSFRSTAGKRVTFEYVKQVEQP